MDPHSGTDVPHGGKRIMTSVKLRLVLQPGRGVTYAVGVREIPRSCDPCAWTADRTRRPAVYKLSAVHPSCPFHGLGGHRKPVLKRTAS